MFLLMLMSMLYVSDVHTYLDAVLQRVKSEQGSSRGVYEFYHGYTSVLCIHSFKLCYSMSKVNKFALSSVLENPVFVLILCQLNVISAGSAVRAHCDL